MRDWIDSRINRLGLAIIVGGLAAIVSIRLRNDGGAPFGSANFAASESRPENLLGIPVVSAGVSYPIAASYGPIDGANPDAAQTAAYRVILDSEWAWYPASLMTRTRLARIVLCVDLKFDGQKRSAIPDFEHDTLFLDVAASRDESYLRKVIHHEFYHLIDERDDGSLYADAQWNRLNPPGFSYGDGGKNMQDDSNPGAWQPSLAGVTSRYAAAGIEEDKAELFAFLMTQPSDVAAESDRDEVVAAKIGLLKQQLQLFCPDLDDAFWNRVAARNN